MTRPPVTCEHCGNDDATLVLALCLDCAESLPDLDDQDDAP